MSPVRIPGMILAYQQTLSVHFRKEIGGIIFSYLLCQNRIIYLQLLVYSGIHHTAIVRDNIVRALCIHILVSYHSLKKINGDENNLISYLLHIISHNQPPDCKRTDIWFSYMGIRGCVKNNQPALFLFQPVIKIIFVGCDIASQVKKCINFMGRCDYHRCDIRRIHIRCRSFELVLYHRKVPGIFLLCIIRIQS